MRPKGQKSDIDYSCWKVNTGGTQLKAKKSVYRSARKAEKFDQLTAFQYFLASLCDAPVDSEGLQLGLRYQQTPEVTALLSKLTRNKLSYSDISTAHPNVIFSVLKEALTQLPPVFPTEELLCFNPTNSEELAHLYLSGLIDALEIDTAHLAYWVSKSLMSLILRSGRKQQSLIDTLVIFTPIIFPACNSQTSFLRATRAVLFMLENSEKVFPTHIIERGDHADNLIELIESIEEDYEYDSGFESTGNLEDETSRDHYLEMDVSNNPAYYMITFDV